jgi:glycosyltransferase involved in cell wall biosynthesis
MPIDQIRVGIFYPADPLGHIPSGVETCIRGILKWAPADLEYTLFGATSDPLARPVGREIVTSFGGRQARLLPIVAADPTATRQPIPLSVRYQWALRRYAREGALRDIDMLDFHRIEPVALFRKDPRPKYLMFHDDMAALRDPHCDIAWRHAPWLYELAERWLLPRCAHVFSVSQSAVVRYRSVHPNLAERFSFIPTWVEQDVFRPVRTHEERSALRGRIAESLNLPADCRIITSVGRLDRQKDPLLLLESVRIALATRPDLFLVLVGDGILRRQLEAEIRSRALSERVRLLGAKPAAEVADWLRISDLFALSSSSEAMPIVVLEALATGTPVVTTDVGEVRRVVTDGRNGVIVEKRTADHFARAICDALSRAEVLRGAPCENAVAPYLAQNVLSKLYDRHRGKLPGTA